MSRALTDLQFGAAMDLVRSTMASVVPAKVIEAFHGRATLPLPELSRAMEMDVKTVRKHIADESLPVHIKGTGVARRHYVCTLADVATFYRATANGASCPSSKLKNHPTISSTSRSRVYAFPGPQSVKMNVTPRKRKSKDGQKPSAS